jgi:hypothetical protein
LQSRASVYACRSTILPFTFLGLFGLCCGIAHAAPAGRCNSLAAVPTADQQALHVNTASTGEPDSRFVNPSDARALDEMLHGGHPAALRWDRVPELVVLMPVMAYEQGHGTEYLATAEQLTDDEAAALVADLSEALAALTDHTVRAFSGIRQENAAAGESVNVMRRGQIVVGRFKGVRDQLATIGFGGRSSTGDTIRGGSIMLDDEFDRASGDRRLLRMHELGHALGYNHVQSQVSIMNPRIGPALTEFDRAAVRVAFQNFSASGAACSS